jgi:hypothetical protein
VFIRDYNSLIEKEEKSYQKEFAEIKKGAELEWEQQRKEALRKQKEEEDSEKEKQLLREASEKLAKEQEEKLKIARQEKEKIEKELNEKKEADEKLKKEAELKAEEELNKGDKEKLTSFMSDLEMMKYKYTFKGKKYQGIQKDVNTLIDKIINHALSK